MNYKINIDNFEGPLDLLLYLIKKKELDILEINIFDVIEQYLQYIKEMEKMDLNIASEYLVMTAELIELKSRFLLPHQTEEEQEELECSKINLLKKIILYEQYKEASFKLKDLEEQRMLMYSKEPYVFSNYEIKEDLNNLVNAFEFLLKRLDDEKPKTTMITKKEYSVSKRIIEIKSILDQKHKVMFSELFSNNNRVFLIVTFLSILDLSKRQYLNIKQEGNFQEIYLIKRM